MIDNVLSFSLATLLLALSPGPDNIYVLSQSLAHGMKSGIATTAGLISGCIVHTTLLAFGVSALITESPRLFYGLKVFGALYLLFLAFKTFQNNGAVSIGAAVPKKTSMQLFWQGVVMNLLNPKVMIFFLAFFPAFLWEPKAETVLQFYILGVTFMIVSFAVFSIIAILSGSISRLLKRQPKIPIVLNWLQIVVFVAIAILILLA
ncbi:LysE family translocator [Altibacter sp. HG106]|uniref:LysE family translocator n=1 Tax=Altibacter sp. HG106 TaxID=3023937 RepID=UPI002350C4A4|nr:LysE family translocator [Altibacter sp. HG106]MDC7996267.1 LysE family translocator [Altibacter sp. HG106]